MRHPDAVARRGYRDRDMNRSLTALFSVFEAVLVVAIGIGIPLVPLTVLWGTQFGFGPDWSVFWRAAVDVWLLGSGVDVRFTLAPALAASLGTPGAGDPFVVTLAVLGFALLTVLLGVRAGRRIAETSQGLLGELVAVATVAVLSLLLTLSALDPSARPSIWQGTLLPPLVFAVGVAIGSAVTRSRNPGDRLGRAVRSRIEAAPEAARSVVLASLRVGTGTAAGLLAAAGIVTAVLVLGGYAKVIALYEGLHTDAAGGAALTVGQLALLPDLVVWAAAWIAGPGFALGTGSSVSPAGTLLGPVPAVPVLGAVPADPGSFGFAGIAVPVVLACVLALVVRRSIAPTWLARGVSAAGAGVVAGVVVGLLAWASAGSAGPGRLAHVGPDPLVVGAIVALEVAIGAALGAGIGALRGTRRPPVPSDDAETAPIPLVAGGEGASR